MNMKIGKAFSLLLISLMLASAMAFIRPAKSQATSIVVNPSYLEFGPGPCVGTTFTVTVEIHDVTNLYGVDIQFGWDEAWLGYVNHQKHIPVEDYPDGILHEPTIPVKDDVFEGSPDPLADPNSDYWLSEASMSPAPAFDGSGIAFEMTFVIKQQPLEPEPDKVLTLNITVATLADVNGQPILYTEVDGTVVIKAKPFEYPPAPLLKVLPEEVSDLPACNNFDVDILLAAWNETTSSIVDLDPLWDVAGFDIMFNFDPTLIEGVTVTIDPAGWFASFWPNGIFIVKQDIDNVAGTVWIAFLGLPDAGGIHTPPSGQGIIATITFHTIYDSESYPPPSCGLTLDPTTIAGFPHPERPQAPWNGSESAPPLPHFVQNGLYTAYFKPPGAWIDIYTQYPDGFNGKGPNEPSDMFWPQKAVIIYAYVTYNFWPEQNKDVAFEVRDPHGELWGFFYNRTDENGLAWVIIRLPWPCDDPEYYLGEWTVIATVDVACKVVNDTLTFKYDYHVRVWKTTIDKESYKHCETITINITFGTYSMQQFDVLFTATAVDETGVPFGYDWTWVTVGWGDDVYCMYWNSSIILTIHVPKFARAGSATIYIGVLHDFPSSGGDAVYPTREPETIVTFGIEAA